MTNSITRKVHVKGIFDIMFDRYAGDNVTDLPPERRFNFDKDGKTIVLPAANISSFLSAQNTDSATKVLYPSKDYKKVARGFMSYTSISPQLVPFLKNGKKIKFSGLDAGEEDTKNGIYVDRRVARLPKGIPNPKARPVLSTPWELKFEITMFPNEVVNEDMLLDVFERGGIAVGFGTYRGVFGKFVVESWK